MSKTIFQKIADGELPAQIVYQDEWVVAFRDINPQAPTHVLIVPRKPIRNLASVTSEDAPLLGHLMVKAAEVARQLGLAESGWRMVFNSGPNAGEAVPHLHGHILGGRKMGWPPG
jgi:histidine triad (HIT) family protein